jgi:hypothetical protein
MFVEKGWFIPTLQFGPDDVFLFEDWEETPAGPYRGLFHFTPDDFRTLYVNNEEGRDLVSSIHRFDVMNVVDISSRREHGRWTIEMEAGERGPLSIEIAYDAPGILKAVNLLSPHIPEIIARNSQYCKLLPRLAAPVLGTDPSQAIAGVTEMGRKTRFRVDRTYKVTEGKCTWGGMDLGQLVDCCFQHDMGAYQTISKAMVSYLSLFVD